MREILKRWIDDGDEYIIVMVFRKHSDPTFYMYYSYVDETEVQRTKYPIDRNDVHYYTGGDWHSC